METFDLQQIINLIPQLTGTASIVLVCFFLYKAGILGALTSWVTRQPNNGRIDDLEAFKITTETNHFHDLDDLKADNKEIWRAVGIMQKDMAKIQADVANINGRLQNGHRNQ